MVKFVTLKELVKLEQENEGTDAIASIKGSF